MIKKVIEFAEKYDMLPKEGIVLAAVSGGADSMCLLDVLCEISKIRGFTVHAIHFDHMIRGDESAGDALFVAEYCKNRGIECHVGSGNVTKLAKEGKTGLEEEARIARYRYFDSVAEKIGAARIATAHTADDNVETVLMNLVRGAGAAGAAGIPPVRGRIIRPILTVTRREIEEHLAQRGIPHREDSTNKSDDYTRNKLRHNIIPTLKEINPSLCSTVSMETRIFAEDEQLISEIAQKFIDDHVVGNRCDRNELLKLPEAVSRRVIKKLCAGAGAQHTEAVLALCRCDDPSAKVSLPKMTVSREYEYICFGKNIEKTTFEPVEIVINGKALIKEAGLEIISESVENCGNIYKSFNTFLFKKSSVCGKIIVRPREGGDTIRLSENCGTKTLKKLFIEKRIPQSERAAIPVIADEKGVIGIYGIGSDVRTKCRPGDSVLKITFKEIIK